MQSLLKALKQTQNACSSVLYWNNARNRTKTFWSKTIGFETSHSFPFRCLNLYLYPRSYSESYLKTVPVNKLIRLANPKRKKFHFTALPLKNQIFNPQKITKKLDRKILFPSTSTESFSARFLLFEFGSSLRRSFIPFKKSWISKNLGLIL